MTVKMAICFAIMHRRLFANYNSVTEMTITTDAAGTKVTVQLTLATAARVGRAGLMLLVSNALQAIVRPKTRRYAVGLLPHAIPSLPFQAFLTVFYLEMLPNCSIVRATLALPMMTRNNAYRRRVIAT
jgi:hypothetical protein